MTTDGTESNQVATDYQHLEQALADFDAGRFESALQNCDKALAAGPSYADAHNLRGVVLDQLGRLEEAACAYGTAVDLEPGHQEAAQNLLELAIELTERLLSDTPFLPDQEGEQPNTLTSAPQWRLKMAKLHVERGYEAYECQEFDSALASSYLAVGLDSESGEAHNLRGLVLEESDRPGAAAEAYRIAFELDSSLSLAEDNRRELEAELAERRSLVSFAAFLHPLEAHIARGILQETGIPTFLADEQMVALNYFWSVSLHGVKLLVTAEDAREAHDILRGQPESVEFNEIDELAQLQCPACQSHHTRYETYNLPLAYLASFLGYFPLWIIKVLFVLLLPAFLVLIPRRAFVCGSCGHIWKADLRPVPQGQDGEAE